MPIYPQEQPLPEDLIFTQIQPGMVLQYDKNGDGIDDSISVYIITQRQGVNYRMKKLYEFHDDDGDGIFEKNELKYIDRGLERLLRSRENDSSEILDGLMPNLENS
jgi:hypothetical protein